MLSIELARELLSAGLLWSPQPGDRFCVPNGEMAHDIFYISEMTIEVHSYPGGRVLGFNGTTEWALDSLELNEVVWLPREEQLRAELGERFLRLSRDDGSWIVTATVGGQAAAFTDPDAEAAYARAVLAMLRTESAPEPTAG